MRATNLMRPRVRKIERALERAVTQLEDRRLAAPARVACGLVLVGVPALQGFSVIESANWLWGFGVAAVAILPLERYHHASVARQIAHRVASINGSLAGSLETLGTKLAKARGRKLQHDQCEGLCSALLHRIKDYTALALDVQGSPRLRVTLAVPVVNTPGAKVESIKVWAYDEMHDDRKYTELPLEASGSIVPGAPAAYVTGEIQIIDDVHTITQLPDADRRPYRSIVSIPLHAQGDNGRTLAVVNIDASEAGFFDIDAVMQKVRPLVSPAINAIGLVLIVKGGKGYDFPR